MKSFSRIAFAVLFLIAVPALAKKKEKTPEVLQISPIEYREGAHYILTELAPHLETYVENLPELSSLKKARKEKAVIYRTKETAVDSKRVACDLITNPLDPARAQCVRDLQTLQSELATVKAEWNALGKQYDQTRANIKTETLPPMVDVNRVHLGILLNTMTKNFAFMIPRGQMNDLVRGYGAGENIRREYDLYTLSAQYFPAVMQAHFFLTLKNKTSGQLYNVNLIYQTPSNIGHIARALFVSGYDPQTGEYGWQLNENAESLFEQMQRMFISYIQEPRGY